ncbi:MAG: flagellar assembly protein FliW [Treponema sp.]|nr:flagellar assembly protein FliW [Treponema sp.]MBQ2552229.1 flagellar assembly protein FliW [Treponema sp.]MBQ4236083.1 flagellar assembly protein FliW [Treponema sp.]
MKVETKVSGLIEVPDDHIIKIPAGLLGFEEYTDFALYDSVYPPFVWMQSIQEKNLAFLMIDPFLICGGYETNIDDRELEKIGITEPSQVLVMALVTVPGNGKPVTANLLGPVIINKATRNGMQVILDGDRWPTKFDIVEGMKQRREGK